MLTLAKSRRQLAALGPLLAASDRRLRITSAATCVAGVVAKGLPGRHGRVDGAPAGRRGGVRAGRSSTTRMKGHEGGAARGYWQSRMADRYRRAGELLP